MIIPDMRIKAITFDWGDTLAANHSMPYRESQRRGLAAMASLLGVDEQAVCSTWSTDCLTDFQRIWDTCMDPAQNPQHQEIDLEAIMNTWVERLEPTASSESAAAAIDACLSEFCNVVVPFVGAAETLQQLKAAGYRIGILSHVAWQSRGCKAWFAQHGFAEAIDFYSLSCDVGWIKPNPKHYQDALDQAGCQVNEVLHVGDHPERDVQAANAFGMRSCLKLTDRIYDDSTLENCAPDYTMMHVKELPSLLATD